MPTVPPASRSASVSVPKPLLAGSSDGTGLPSSHKHIAQFAHREGIRYFDIRPVSGLANAFGRRSVFPRSWRSDIQFRLRFAYRCGGSPGIARHLSALTGFPFHSPTHTVGSEHLTTLGRVKHGGGNDNKSMAVRPPLGVISPPLEAAIDNARAQRCTSRL
jgi:hypothetical protein